MSLANRGCHARGARSMARPFTLAARPQKIRRLLLRCTAQHETQDVHGRRAMLANIATGLVATGLLACKPVAAEPFLQSTGARGILADEERELYNLRLKKEGEARRGLEKAREEFEQESRATQDGKLCATPFGVDIVGITELIALIGALVGGVTARQRKDEVERLNEQLRKINITLRQQARAGTVYAPGLTYAPSSRGTDIGSPLATGAEQAEASTAAVAVATATMAAPAAAPASLVSMEEDEMSPDQLQCRDSLRRGKRLLKEKNGAAAMVRFEKALMLSKAVGDRVQERRAERGLAASARLQSQYRAAIGHLERVLEISKEIREFTGDADAYGVIADCYTDLGEYEKAAGFYDKYIDTMNKEGNSVL